MTKLGITASRNGITEKQKEAFLDWLKEQDIDMVHHGCCIGGDEEIHDIIREFNEEILIFGHPAIVASKYKSDCKCDIWWVIKKPLDRNHDIVNSSEIMAAFPAGPEIIRSGTWATIRYTKKMYKKLYIFWPDGEVYDY